METNNQLTLNSKYIYLPYDCKESVENKLEINEMVLNNLNITTKKIDDLFGKLSKNIQEKDSLNDIFKDFLGLGETKIAFSVLNNLNITIQKIDDLFGKLSKNIQEKDSLNDIFKDFVGQGETKMAFSLRRGNGKTSGCDVVKTYLSEHSLIKETKNETPFTIEEIQILTLQRSLQQRIENSIMKRKDAGKEPRPEMKIWEHIVSSKNPGAEWETHSYEEQKKLTETLTDCLDKKRLILLLPKIHNKQSFLKKEIENHCAVIEGIKSTLQEKINALRYKFPHIDLLDITAVSKCLQTEKNTPLLEELLRYLQGIKHIIIPTPQTLNLLFFVQLIKNTNQNVSKLLKYDYPIEFDRNLPVFIAEKKGGEFRKIIKQDQLTLQDKIGVFIDIAHAVYSLNVSGFMHRDISERNILIHKNAIPRKTGEKTDRTYDGFLTDLSLTEKKGSRRLLKPLEAAPETMAQTINGGKEHDTSDIYSLCFTILTGLCKNPVIYSGKNSQIYEQLQDAYDRGERPSLLASEINQLKNELNISEEKTKDLIGLIEKGLSIDPNQRPLHLEIIDTLTKIYNILN